jgi:hypothetical protein
LRTSVAGTAGGFVANPEGNTGSSTIWNVPVTLSGPSTVPVTVDRKTFDLVANPSVALSGSDHVAAAGREWGLVQLADPTFTKVTGGLFGFGLYIIDDD